MHAAVPPYLHAARCPWQVEPRERADAETRATEAEDRARLAARRATEAEERARLAETRATEAETKRQKELASLQTKRQKEERERQRIVSEAMRIESLSDQMSKCMVLTLESSKKQRAELEASP